MKYAVAFRQINAQGQESEVAQGVLTFADGKASGTDRVRDMLANIVVLSPDRSGVVLTPADGDAWLTGFADEVTRNGYYTMRPA